MGKKAQFSAEYEKDYSDSEKIWVINKLPRKEVGWIVGFSFCCDGTLQRESDMDIPYAPTYNYNIWKSKKRNNYIAIRRTPTSPIIKVPYEYCSALCLKVELKNCD